MDSQPHARFATGSRPCPQARRVGELVSKMLTSIDIELDDPDYLFRRWCGFIRTGVSDADGCVWCAGFLRGMAHAWDRWSSLCDLQDMASPAVADSPAGGPRPGARTRG